MHEFDKTSTGKKKHILYKFTNKSLLLQHDNRVKFLLNLMLRYDDQVYVDKLLYFHVKDQEPKINHENFWKTKMKFFVLQRHIFLMHQIIYFDKVFLQF
jgi:hypothetical protein